MTKTKPEAPAPPPQCRPVAAAVGHGLSSRAWSSTGGAMLAIHTQISDNPPNHDFKAASQGALAILAAVLLLSQPAAAGVDDELPHPKETEAWDPEPAVVSPAAAGGAPSDAIVLFDGQGTSGWRHTDGSKVKWRLGDGALTVVGGTGNIETRRKFGDMQLHLEWRAPAVIDGKGQGRGNSGVFLQRRYEIQVLDSYENRTYANGQAGSLYKQHSPLVNASLPPGEWQSYDLVFRAPRFSDSGTLVSPAFVTLFHNGVLVLDHVDVQGSTTFIGAPSYEPHEPRQPLMLQDHRNPVSFRNIWVRELDLR